MKIITILFFVLICTSSIFSQQSKHANSDNQIKGLKMSDKVAHLMQNVKAKEFYVKGNKLYPNKGFRIILSNKGSYYINSIKSKIGSDYKFEDQDDVTIVEDHPNMVVVYKCTGCNTSTSCLVGSSNGNHACTAGCILCDGTYEIILIDTVSEVMTPF